MRTFLVEGQGITTLFAETAVAEDFARRDAEVKGYPITLWSDRGYALTFYPDGEASTPFRREVREA